MPPPPVPPPAAGGSGSGGSGDGGAGDGGAGEGGDGGGAAATSVQSTLLTFRPAALNTRQEVSPVTSSEIVATPVKGAPTAAPTPEGLAGEAATPLAAVELGAEKAAASGSDRRRA